MAAPDRVRIGDAVFGRPFPAEGVDRCYPDGTMLTDVTHDDGDGGFVTVASRDVLAAFDMEPRPRPEDA
jgi:hypothetical protein